MPKTNVVDLCAHRTRRNAEARRKRNDAFAVRLLSRWSDKGPASGHSLFRAILQKAVDGPIATPERARALLPILLEVLDEMEEIQTALTWASECGDQSGVGDQKMVPASGFEPLTPRV